MTCDVSNPRSATPEWRCWHPRPAAACLPQNAVIAPAATSATGGSPGSAVPRGAGASGCTAGPASNYTARCPNGRSGVVGLITLGARYRTAWGGGMKRARHGPAAQGASLAGVGKHGASTAAAALRSGGLRRKTAAPVWERAHDRVVERGNDRLSLLMTLTGSPPSRHRRRFDHYSPILRSWGLDYSIAPG
jgi:hypothetical protein